MLQMSTISSLISQDLRAALRFVSRAGFDGIDLDRVWGQPIEQLAASDDRTALQRVLASEANKVYCLATGIFRCWPDSPDALREHERLLEASLALAETLGVRLVRCFAFLRGTTAEDQWPRLLERLESAARLAAQHGVQLGVQNDPQTLIGTGGEAARAIEAIGSNSLKVVWDPCASVFDIDHPEIPFPDGYQRVRPHLAHVILRDVDRQKYHGRFREVELGEGIIDLRGQLRALLADGHDIAASIVTGWRPGTAWDLDPEAGDFTESGSREAVRTCLANARAILAGVPMPPAAAAIDRHSPGLQDADDSTAATIWARPEADSVEGFAAAELQRYLGRMLGRPVPLRLFEQASPLPGLCLTLGTAAPAGLSTTPAAGLPPDGYVLRGSQDGAMLQSPTARGLLYAVYGLLRHLGARWFFPGPSGELIPQLRSISLTGLNVSTAPVIAERGVLIRGTDRLLKEWIEFAPRIGLNAFALETHEGIHRLPELAARRGLHLRLRRHFFPPVFCSQDERTLHWEETLMKGYLGSLPAEIDSIQVRPADAFGGRCSCPADAPFSLADQVMRFTNRMARAAREVRPDLEYPYVAYLSTWCPPPRIQPGPGVTLSMGTIHRCFNHAIDDPDCWINSTYRYDRPLGELEYGLRPILEEHMERFDPAHTCVVDYWVDASLFERDFMSHWEGRLPNNGAVMQRDIRYYHSLGIPAIWSFVVFIDDRYLERFTSPLIFQYGALLWDPNADLAAGLRDFCRHYYADEGLASVFPLYELSDPRHLVREAWINQKAQVSRAMQIASEAAHGARDDAIRGRLNALVAEQRLCVVALERYLAEATDGA